MRFHVTTARIHGLNDDPYFFAHRLFYAWAITFSESPLYNLLDMYYIKVGDIEEDAKKFCNMLKQNFKKANIEENSKVVILYDKELNVEAIAHIEDGLDVSLVSNLEKLCWIDVKNKFVVKSFEELGLYITSLIVH